ncbi:DUF4232 domain-containing protein [Streptomyces polygonati]|uniref:DUF4232 domain-containing protein n=1 Tax=Streptomyces polygonati TaxID=1617087 RepID=A0ABV8HLA3_9ACTN
MTGFPDDDLAGSPAGPSAPREPGPSGSGRSAQDADGDAPESLPRSPAPFLSAPPGSFQRIRRRAARRRRIRAAVGGSAAVAVVAGALYVAGSLHTGGGDEVVGPPASSVRHSPPSVTGTAPSTARPLPPSVSGSTGSPVTRPVPVAPAPDTKPPTTPGTGSPTVPPRPTSSGGATSPATTAMCTAAQLSAALGGGDAGAGNLYRYLVLTNTSTTACHLTGFPGLSLLDANGAQIGDPATREPVAYQPVVLAPGGSASDTVHTVNHQGACLPESVRVRVYPPGSRASLVFPGKITNCDDLLAITPLTGGETGNPPS